MLSLRDLSSGNMATALGIAIYTHAVEYGHSIGYCIIHSVTVEYDLLDLACHKGNSQL